MCSMVKEAICPTLIELCLSQRHPPATAGGTDSGIYLRDTHPLPQVVLTSLICYTPLARLVGQSARQNAPQSKYQAVNG